MESGNIRNAALAWFNNKYPGEEEGIFSSKFYTSQESWSNSRVWFFQIPAAILEPRKIRFIHLLCENPQKGEAFIYLKVPVSFMLMNEKAFDIGPRQKVFRIYLSAEAADRFLEVRKKGSRIDFTKYVQ